MAATAANASCPPEYSGPGWLVVKRGSTRPSTASVVTVPSAVAAPSALKSAVRARRAPTRTEMPRIPLQVIITAAKTVSRASTAVSCGSPDTISVTISATSITVTAIARTSDPNGSPTRWATTSAWCTAASTQPTSSGAPSTSTSVPGSAPNVSAAASAPASGSAVVHPGARPGARRDTEVVTADISGAGSAVEDGARVPGRLHRADDPQRAALHLRHADAERGRDVRDGLARQQHAGDRQLPRGQPRRRGRHRL